MASVKTNLTGLCAHHMEKVRTLLKKLQDQLDAGASAGELSLTARMLLTELSRHDKSAESPMAGDVAIHIPVSVLSGAVPEDLPVPAETREIRVLEVDEAAVAAELEEIRKKAEERSRMVAQNKLPVAFDALEETPTLITQMPPKAPPSEINDQVAEKKSSLNDQFLQSSPELSETLKEPSVNDLRKAIGVNDRYLFINELFRGDEAMYDRSIKTINGFTSADDAEQWIRRELKVKLGWDEETHAVRQFDYLVKRRFS